jgi:excisionase family DNA binding protein
MNMQVEDTRLLSVKEAARVLHVSPFSLYRKLQSQELPGGLKFGRKVLVDINTVLAAMRRSATVGVAQGKESP